MKSTHTLKTLLLCMLSGLLSLSLLASDAKVSPQKPALLPLPQSIAWEGNAIPIQQAGIVLPDKGDDAMRLGQLKLELKELLEQNKITVSDTAEQKIIFKIGKVEAAGQWEGQKDEAYSLVAEPRGVVVTANTTTGLYRGLQTLRQLIVSKDGKTTVAACKIEDYPAFKIRGVMHDVGRNFQSIDQLKMQIDVLAKYKYSIFHFHLTDHYGWRLESKKYPGLQADSAFTRMPGKYYSQKEFVDFVDYCWARGITVIPEFDSPGHSDAFRKGVGVANMKDPKALKAMIDLIDEVCALVPKEKMPYFHVGTDEVRHREEHVDGNYLPALHKAVQDNGREVIGWWKGMTFKGAKQAQQTWAQASPMNGVHHIDSRSNYVNHMEALDFATRMFFQQPCRVPHGDEQQLGGILCHWPDTKVDDQKLIMTNNPVLPAIVAYSEAVWHGIAKDHSAYWAKLPEKGTAEYEAFADFENRIAEQRDRFLTDVPFPMVKTHQIEWRLLGQVEDGAVPELEKGIVKDSYEVDGNPFNWSKPVYGGAIHSRHFFSFPSHYGGRPKGKDIVWGNTHVYSPVDQEVDAWISFNTISSSDERAGIAKAGNWGPNPACKIWINGESIDPPKWKNDGKAGKEIALIDQVYTSREPTKIKLKKGWNTVLVKSAPTWKWVFSFSPVEKIGQSYREIEGLKYSATPPAN